MRHKKSKLIYYIPVLAVIAGLIYIATQEIPLKSEHVSQPITNDFLSK